MVGLLPGSAQSFLHYLPIDSARQIIANAKTPEDKFYGYYGARLALKIKPEKGITGKKFLPPSNMQNKISRK